MNFFFASHVRVFGPGEVIRRVGIPESNLTLPGANLQQTWFEHRCAGGSAFLSRDLCPSFENLVCYTVRRIIPNRFVATRCPGQFIVDEIVWDQGLASMAHFCRNDL